MRWIYLAVLILAFTTAVYADTPLVSAQVVVDNGVTRYIYTLTNILSSGKILGLGGLVLPDGSLSFSHSEPYGWYLWYPKFPENKPTEFYWSVVIEQAILQPGQSAVFEIYTSEPVVTQWTNYWGVGVRPDEGRDYSYSGGTPLPVPAPIPEPSSILALAGGLVGVGGFALRRRR